MRFTCLSSRTFSVLLIASTLALAGAHPRNARAQGAGPTTVSQAAFPITVNGGEYSLVQVILEFAPGPACRATSTAGPSS